MKTNIIKRALLALTLLLSLNTAWAADYVIVRNGNYYNGTTAGTTTFDPQTCIWSGTSGGRFTNGAGTTLSFNSNTNWTLSSNRFQYTSWNTTYYIGYSSSKWQRVSGTNNAANVYQVTTTTNQTTITSASISGSSRISESTDYTASAMGQRCTTYTWSGNTGITAGCQEIQLTSGVTYAWSVSNNSYATINSTTGRLTVNSLPTNNTDITITLSATYGSQTRTANKSVTILGTTPTAPIINNYLNHVTISKEVSTDVVRYTIDGSTPTCSTGTVYNGTFDITSTPVTIKAIACRNGNASAVATKTISYIPSATGVYGDSVVLMDWEDLSWTYYAGVDASVDNGNYNTNYLGKLYSPDARNIIIEYRGGSVNNASAVAISGQTGENQNKMIYYQTMEKDRTNNNYPYTVIPNPFSKRPKLNSTYYGFGGWKIISGGDKINGYNNDQTLPLDADITFTNSLANGDRIVLEATWVSATVKTGNSAQSFTGGTYETNFWVITGGNVTSDLNNLNTNMTVTMYYPDGTKAETNTRSITKSITVSNSFSGTVKFEYVNFNTTSDINAGGRNLYVGRGITNSNNSGHGYIYGCNTSSTQVNQTVRVESGKYQHFYHYAKAPRSITKQIVIFGCDYDRAKNDNNKLDFTGVCKISSDLNFGLSNSTTMLTRTYSKSGKIMSSRSVNDAKTADVYYFSPDGSGDYKGGCRYLEIQGGEWCSIAGGFDKYHNSTDPAFTFRMKGGKLRGSIYGSGEFLEARGIRVYVITGGEINGWVAGGANGTKQDGGGVTDGKTYLYIGGNARIDSHGATAEINNSVGGNVYGAGCGLSATSTSGEVTQGTNVVIADEAFVERGVYGGGGFGYCNTDQTATMYITGGTVNAGLGAYNGSSYIASIQGGVFGGASMNKGGSAQIYMTDGTVKHGIYGGSNMSGTLNGSTTIKMVGGKVGLSSSEQGHICGGGFGSDTRVKENTDVTIDGTATVYGEVYGGSEQGLVNTDANSASYQSGKHVNVTVSGGTIHGAVYGGGLGTSANAANTYGNTKVTISGGTVDGNVFGCNNVNGRPFDSTVQVEMTDGTVKKHVFGGGNQAGYTGNTEVKILGGTVEGNVYGGGYGTGATVTGSTNVIIGE